MIKHKNLTASQVWEIYAADSVELFVSNFKSEGYNDITEMCQRYVKDIPHVFERMYSQDQLDDIANKLKQYISDYLNEIGGINRLKIYSEDELEEIDKQQERELFLEIMDYIKKLK